MFWHKHRHTLPPLGSAVSWKVYCLSKDWFSHYSLLFETKDGTGSFVIELLKVKDDEPGYRMAFSTRFINIHKSHTVKNSSDSCGKHIVTLNTICHRSHYKVVRVTDLSLQMLPCWQVR